MESNHLKTNKDADAMAIVDIMSKWAAKNYRGRAGEWIGLAWIAWSEAKLTYRSGGVSPRNWAWWRFMDLIHLELAIPKKIKKKEEDENDESPPRLYL